MASFLISSDKAGIRHTISKHRNYDDPLPIPGADTSIPDISRFTSMATSNSQSHLLAAQTPPDRSHKTHNLKTLPESKLQSREVLKWSFSINNYYLLLLVNISLFKILNYQFEVIDNHALEKIESQTRRTPRNPRRQESTEASKPRSRRHQRFTKCPSLKTRIFIFSVYFVFKQTGRFYN